MQTNHTTQELDYYGIYKITNIINNDFYIGSTIESFKKRKAKHISDIKHGKPNCTRLFNAATKYGVNNFKFEIVRPFKNKKDSKRTKEIITYFEERYIRDLKPHYNISLFPTIGGCPNLGRKLSQEWKNKIGEKSKLYKHTGKIFSKVEKQNKENSSLYIVNDEFTGSLIECSTHYDVDICTILNVLNQKHKSKKIKNVVKIKNQKKKILLTLNEESILFNSYSECDKFLNMWRGFTSTQVVNNKKHILNYSYKIINEDIV